ncbi:MAG: nucleotidyltransferase domain-containing protein [Sphingobacteriales bacterium]|nr:MAG: nucleotidyltransferase domain-containing protein [Sphingobacteriales bacterium]
MEARRKQILQWLKSILDKHLGNTYRAFVFGSQANFSNLKHADIDLGILSDMPITSIQLMQINDAIEELPMLYNIDIIDFNLVDAKFRSIALQNIEWI